jgi:hypothetical protein
MQGAMLLCCTEAMLLQRDSLTFRRNIPSPSSVSKSEPTNKPVRSRCLAKYSILKMQAINSSETSLNYTTLHIPQDGTPYKMKGSY